MIVAPVHEPIFQPIAQAITAALGGFNPRSLFTDGSIGVLYDNSDLSTFFSDSAGTTPAVVNGPVGLQLDKSQGLVLGTELVTNGDFSGGTTGWTLGAGWSVSGGQALSDGLSTNTNMYFTSAILTVGKYYEVTYTLASVTSGGIQVYMGLGSGGVLRTAPGTYTERLLCLSTTQLYIYNRSNFAGAVDNISVKELPGNHRYQSTTGFKPVLRGTPTGSELFTAYGTPGAGWSVAGATGTATTASSALPTTTASVVGKFYRVTYTVTRSAGSVQLSFGGRTGVSRSAAGQYVEYFDNTTTTAVLTATGTSFTGTVRIDEVKDVSAGSVTAPYGLQYDGLDDFLQTASVNFSATDKMFVCAGVRKLSDAANAIAAELGTAGSGQTTGRFSLFTPRFGMSSVGFQSTGDGVGVADPYHTGLAAPITLVVTGVGNISGDSAIVRVNGAQAATSATDQGTGNYGNYPLYFGRRAGTSLPFNGLDFGLCIVGKIPSASQISNTERYIAQRTGVSI